MSHGYIAYIDEAGDDGLGKFRAVGQDGQTHWLGIGACLVSAENDRLMPAWRDEIIGAFPRRRRRDLHFRELDHNQRVHAVRVIARKPLGSIIVLSNKRTLVGHPGYKQFKQKNLLYKYLLRYALERISDACHRRHQRSPCGDGRAKIVFSRRGAMNYPEFMEYMIKLRDLQGERGGWHLIKWDSLDIEGLEAVDHSTRAGLQIADVITSAFFQAVEPNPYGQYEPRYAYELRNTVMRTAQGEYMNYGIKPVPNLSQMVLDEDQRRFFEFWATRKEGQAPGP